MYNARNAVCMHLVISAFTDGNTGTFCINRGALVNDQFLCISGNQPGGMKFYFIEQGAVFFNTTLSQR